MIRIKSNQKSPHSKSNDRPSWQHFLSLTLNIDLDFVNMNHGAEYVGQMGHHA